MHYSRACVWQNHCSGQGHSPGQGHSSWPDCSLRQGLLFYLVTAPTKACLTTYLGKGLKTVRMTLFHLPPSAQESPAESERIFRGAASPRTECDRPADGQQQGRLPGGHDGVRDAQADPVRRCIRPQQRGRMFHTTGLYDKEIVSHLLTFLKASCPWFLQVPHFC